MSYIKSFTKTKNNTEAIIDESKNKNELFDECNLGVAKSKVVGNLGGLVLLGGYVLDSDVISVTGSIGVSYSFGKYIYHKTRYRL